MNAYIEILSENTESRFELHPFHLALIGEFTRENISNLLNRGNWFEVGIYGWVDFHAVCGEVDIPWGTEEANRLYTLKRTKDVK